MRLICPNCAAQYEVDEGVIPEAGRDVQCSNCGHTWWQERLAGPGSEAPLAEAAGAARPEAPEAAAVAESARWPSEGKAWEDEQPLPGPAAEPAARTWPEAPDEHAAASAHTQPKWPEAPTEAPSAPAAPPPHVRPQRTLDEAVLDVLRQEAEREARARRAGGPVETQQDLGLAGAPAGVDAAVRDRIEMMQGLEAEGVEDEAGRPERRVRRSKLPDVEEINSTLASQQMAEAAAGGPVARAATAGHRSGFRTGFTLMILIAIAIGAVYSYADRIVAAAPATAPAMEVFVGVLDAARIWLDKAALSATEAITSLTESE